MKRLAMVIGLFLAVATIVAPISAYALFYTDRTAWEASVGTFTPVDLPGTNGQTLASWTSIALPYGGFFNNGEPLQRLDLGTGWNTWSPGTPTGTELLYAFQDNGAGAFVANFTFYPDGSSVGPVSAFGFEAEPEMYGLFDILLYTALGEVTQTVNGYGGAKFFGWVGEDVTGFSVVSYAGSDGFAMGRFVEGGAPVPEPSTMILLGAGLAGIAFLRRKVKA